jgi:hypothetical protein
MIRAYLLLLRLFGRRLQPIPKVDPLATLKGK